MAVVRCSSTTRRQPIRGSFTVARGFNWWYCQGMAFSRAIIFLWLSALYLPATPGIMAVYYVDPVRGSDTNGGLSVSNAFASLAKARDTVRTVNINMTGDIEVILRGGIYVLTSPLEFGAADSGTGGH